MRLISSVLLGFVVHAPVQGQVQTARFAQHQEVAGQVQTSDSLLLGQKEADPSFGQRAALAVVGSLVAGLSLRNRDVPYDYALVPLVYITGAAAGSSLAGVPADNPNVLGSVAGALIGATPLLLIALQGDTGDTAGIDLVVVPIAIVTIPIGAASGGRWLRFGTN